MPQSLVRNGVHLVFSTKHRETIIAPETSAKLHAYLAGTLNALDCPALTVGGHVDHVHLLFLLAKTLPICKAVEGVKKESSKWAKEHVHLGFSRGPSGLRPTLTRPTKMSGTARPTKLDKVVVRDRAFRPTKQVQPALNTSSRCSWAAGGSTSPASPRIGAAPARAFRRVLW